MKTKEIDYLNPESKYYYKGFKCVVNDNSSISWHDEKGTMRKGIRYWNNGNKHLEYYFNENAQQHNEDGPAYIIYKENGEVKTENYFLNDKPTNKRDLKFKITVTL